MARYEMQEMNLPNEKGERILFPRLVLYGQVDSQRLAQELAGDTTFNAGEVVGLLAAFTRKMAAYLGQGYSVKLEELGVFTASLKLRKGKERESGNPEEARRNATSICVGGIKFRPDKQFVSLTNDHCRLKRSVQKFRRSSQKYTPAERLALAQQYLSARPYLTVGDYVALTGLCRTSASLELRKWAEQADSGIDISGFGTHRVYIRRAPVNDGSTF